MNFWVTPSGTVYQGHTSGSWHTDFCNSYLDSHDDIAERMYKYMLINKNDYIHDFFEKELCWVRYSECGNAGWVKFSNKKLAQS